MIQKNWDELDATLATQQFLSGSQFSPADILISVIAHWDVWLPQLSIKLGKNVQRLVNEVVARPTYQQALAAEQVTYQKAA
jgi:glutathione S-transferase